jgi:YggT family protein
MLILIIQKFFEIFQITLLVWVLMSWIPDFQRNIVYATLDRFFNTILAPIRRIIPPIGGTLDISPMILIFGLGLISRLLLTVL